MKNQIEANKTFGKIDFNGTTSEVFTYLGRVYIKIVNGNINRHYVWSDGSDVWLTTYTQENELFNINEQIRSNYIGKQMLTTVDAVLKTLLNIDNSNTQEYKHAVKNSPSALEWISGLQKAKSSVEWWFANGCPLEEKDLAKVHEWSEQTELSDEVTASKNIAKTILRVRKKNSEMETSNDPR